MGNQISADNISGHDKAYEEQENAIKKMLSYFTRIQNMSTAALAGHPSAGAPASSNSAAPVLQNYKPAPNMTTLGNYNGSFHTK